MDEDAEIEDGAVIKILRVLCVCVCVCACMYRLAQSHKLQL